ncbi:hypothetical protein C8J56DRAFT_920908 [Mycena floridula]|nr:hypothetical protein C8J56DRAFT_920908 [Mycena floridula]
MGLFKFFEILPEPTTEHALNFKLMTPRRSCRRMTICNEMLQPNPVHIPLEVAILVMEAAYYSELAVDNDLLRVCSLVCRDWATPAQQLLFSQISLRTESAFEAFCNATSPATEHGKALAASVLRMRIVIDHNQPFGLTALSFAQAVAQCPNLHELNLSLYGSAAPGEDIIGSPDLHRMQRSAPSFEQSTLELLKSGPSITALQFTNWSENRHSLYCPWTGNAPELPSPSSAPFTGSLDELQMNFQHSPSSIFVKWLLHNSADSLRVLGFARESTSDLAEYVINTHSRTLESVILPACSSKHIEALQKCESLRNFSIESTSVSGCRSLSPKLETLAFAIDKSTSLLAVLDTVKTKKCLKAVTVHIWNDGQLNPQLSSLQIACAYRGIELKMTCDVNVFRALIRGDRISQPTFGLDVI